jgi:hypothetical protein
MRQAGGVKSLDYENKIREAVEAYKLVCQRPLLLSALALNLSYCTTGPFFGTGDSHSSSMS